MAVDWGGSLDDLVAVLYFAMGVVSVGALWIKGLLIR